MMNFMILFAITVLIAAYSGIIFLQAQLKKMRD